MDKMILTQAECLVKTGVILPQTKELKDAGRWAKNRSSRAFRGHMALSQSSSRNAKLQNHETKNVHCLRHSVCGTLLGQS